MASTRSRTGLEAGSHIHALYPSRPNGACALVLICKRGRWATGADGGGIWNFSIPHLSEACECETAPEALPQLLFSPAHACPQGLGGL